MTLTILKNILIASSQDLGAADMILPTATDLSMCRTPSPRQRSISVTAEEGCSSAGYRDVPCNAWYHQYVDHALNHQYMTGRRRTCSPGRYVTRAQWQRSCTPRRENPHWEKHVLRRCGNRGSGITIPCSGVPPTDWWPDIPTETSWTGGCHHPRNVGRRSCTSLPRRKGRTPEPGKPHPLLSDASIGYPITRVPAMRWAVSIDWSRERIPGLSAPKRPPPARRSPSS